MAKKERFEDLTNNLIDLIGGKENISFFTHCVTRLRFNLKDKGLAKIEEIEKISGVVGCQWSGEQLQVIIGQAVGDAYDLICKKTGLEKEEAIKENLDGEKKKFSIGAVVDGFAGCVTPLIPMMIGAGLIKVIVLLGTQLGLLSVESSTYLVLSLVGDAGFYFFPVYVGATAARKFGANMGLGMLVGAMLIHPSFIEAVAAGTPLSIFGLPIYAATYANGIFSTILAVFVMSYIEKFVAKHSPDAIRSITVPLITLLIIVPLTFCLLGPIGSFLGIYLAQAINWLYNTVGFFGVAVLSALYPLIVMTGMHTAFSPYLLASFATIGYDPIICPANFISNFNQGAACIAVALKSKDVNLKSVASSSAVTALVGGVTEPAMFGVNLKLKTPLYASMIGSFCGAAFIGLFNVYIYSFPGSGGLFGLPAFIGPTSKNIIYMLIGSLIGIVVTFIMTLILYKPAKADEAR
ncbi:MAG: PTS transporter subunit EIIC [Anaerorhabdus sp.]